MNKIKQEPADDQYGNDSEWTLETSGDYDCTISCENEVKIEVYSVGK
jgi:hypothetical protein